MHEYNLIYNIFGCFLRTIALLEGEPLPQLSFCWLSSMIALCSVLLMLPSTLLSFHFPPVKKKWGRWKRNKYLSFQTNVFLRTCFWFLIFLSFLPTLYTLLCPFFIFDVLVAICFSLHSFPFLWSSFPWHMFLFLLFSSLLPPFYSLCTSFFSYLSLAFLLFFHPSDFITILHFSSLMISYFTSFSVLFLTSLLFICFCFLCLQKKRFLFGTEN